MAEASVITVAHHRHDHLLRQRAMLRELAPGTPHVVIAMGDPAIRELLADDPDAVVVDLPAERSALPLAAARNAGVARALTDRPALVVLLDVDCLPGPGLLPGYLAASREAPGDLLCGPVTYLPEGVSPRSAFDLPALSAPHAARPSPPPGELVRGGEHDLFWSLSFAATPATWERVGGFCEEYVGYGGEDTDYAWTARKRGVGLTWVGGAEAFHQWHPVSSPPVEHVEDIVRNARIAHRRHGRWPMTGWIEQLAARGLLRWCEDGADLEVVTPRPATPRPPTIGA